MFIAAFLAFFVFIFLLATITVAIAWMAFLKRQAEKSEAGEPAATRRNPLETGRGLPAVPQRALEQR